MKKAILGLVGLLALAILIVVAMAMTKPDTIHVERSITVKATDAELVTFTTDMKRVNEWSPWNDKDPNLKQTYSETTSGVGAWYGWDGNEEVGSGKQTIASIEPGKVVHTLEFFTPMEGVASATTTWTSTGDQTAVTWAFDQDADFGAKMFMVFQDFDAFLGPDFAKGLALLQPLVETAAQERVAAEKAAAEEAAKLAAAEEAAKAEGEEPAKE